MGLMLNQSTYSFQAEEAQVNLIYKVIYNVISKTLLHHYKNPEKPRVLLLGPTGISAANIGKATIHSDLRTKPGTKLLSLHDKSEAFFKKSVVRWIF